MVQTATIYTDGSCNTQYLAGAWVAIILTGPERKQLSGVEMNTTHNRMELTAVVKGIEYLRQHHKEITFVTICSDSQYVIGLQARKQKMTTLGFTSKKGKLLQNADLMKKLLELFAFFEMDFIKIKAHQKRNDINAYNIEADLLSRKLVRAAVQEKFI